MIESPDRVGVARRPPLVWVRRRELVALALAFLGPPTLAWAQYLAFGLPPVWGNDDPANPLGPHHFPAWLRLWHYVDLLLVVLLARGGWAILRDRPGLAWAPGGPDWLRLGVAPPRDFDAGRARYRHALLGVAWAAGSAVYVLLVAATGAWEHLFPMRWSVVPEAWRRFVQYATFHLSLDPDGYYLYNSLQLLSYVIVMLGVVPLIALSGLAIAPAVGGRNSRLARPFGNVEAARSVHHLAILVYLAFLAVHVFFVVLYAAWLDWDHVVLGPDETGLPGGLIFGAGVGLIAAVVLLAGRSGRGRA